MMSVQHYLTVQHWTLVKSVVCHHSMFSDHFDGVHETGELSLTVASSKLCAFIQFLTLDGQKNSTQTSEYKTLLISALGDVQVL